MSLAPTVLTRRRNGDELIVKVENLNARQLDFAERSGGHFVGPGQAICHTYTVEKVANPGEVVIGTDSHTCTSGAVGAFAFGVGATDIAAAWFNRQILVTVPEVVTVNLTGRLRDGVCAKDVALTLLTHPGITGRQTIGRVLLFAGPGLADLDIDERTTLCNMAVEAGATTAVVEPDAVTDEFVRRRGTGKRERRAGRRGCDLRRRRRHRPRRDRADGVAARRSAQRRPAELDRRDGGRRARVPGDPVRRAR